jgi:hypothetical protein
LATSPRRLGISLGVAGLALTVLGVGPADAAGPAIGLGTAASFALLAGTTVTNTGPSTISGDLGVSPGTAITGFPSGTVVNGTTHSADGVAAQAQADVTTAYNAAAAQTATGAVTADLGGQTLPAGVYSAGALQLTGTLTLDAADDPNAVFVFQAASTLTTAPTSAVALLRGANACNIFWQVGSSATLGTNSFLAGTVLALTSISATTGAKIDGRLLARNGAATLDTNAVAVPACAAALPTSSAVPTTAPTAAATAGAKPVTAPAAAVTTSPSAAAATTVSATPSATSPAPVDTPAGEIPGTQPPLPITGIPVSGLAGAGLLILGVGLLLLLMSVRHPREQRAR